MSSDDKQCPMAWQRTLQDSFGCVDGRGRLHLPTLAEKKGQAQGRQVVQTAAHVGDVRLHPTTKGHYIYKNAFSRYACSLFKLYTID